MIHLFFFFYFRNGIYNRYELNRIFSLLELIEYCRSQHSLPITTRTITIVRKIGFDNNSARYTFTTKVNPPRNLADIGAILYRD